MGVSTTPTPAGRAEDCGRPAATGRPGSWKAGRERSPSSCTSSCARIRSRADRSTRMRLVAPELKLHGDAQCQHPLDHRGEGHDVDRLSQYGDSRLLSARISDDGCSRDDDHGNPRFPLAQRREDLPARHTGHLQIGKDDVVLALVEEGERLGPTAGSIGAVAEGADEIDQHVPDDGVVVYQEDSRILTDARHDREGLRSRCQWARNSAKPPPKLTSELPIGMEPGHVWSLTYQFPEAPFTGGQILANPA